MLKNNGKKALVLSGGSAFGAFQFGALKYLLQKGGYTGWDIVTGVSVGALNGTMVAWDKFDKLEMIWSEISNKKVYTGNPDIEGLVGNLRVLWHEFRKKSLLDNTPLSNKLEDVIDTKDLIRHLTEKNRKLVIGIVSLADGKYYAVQPCQFRENLGDFKKAVLASTAIPMFWPPVGEIHLEEGRVIYQAVDGGVRNNAPLGDAMIEAPKEVVVINCDPYEVPNRKKIYTGIFGVAMRASIEIQHNETFRMDIKEYLRLNEMAKQNGRATIIRGKDRILEPVCIKLILPSADDEDEMGSAFSFSQDDVQRRINLGRVRAEECLRDPEAIIRKFLQNTSTRA